MGSDFALLDKDCSGALDEDEIKVLFSRQLNGQEPAPEALADFFKTVDKDQNGRVNFIEYMGYVLGKGWTLEGQPPYIQVDDVAKSEFPVTVAAEDVVLFLEQPSNWIRL